MDQAHQVLPYGVHPDNPIDGPSDWFIRPMNPDPESTCFQDENCDGIPETSCDDFPNDSLLLLNGYGGLHSEGLTWQARKTVLRKFWEDPDFGCNASMSTNFKSSHHNSNLGLLAQIANDVSTLLKISEPIAQYLDTLSSIIQAESEEIISIDAWWEDEEADLESWKQQRDIHVENIINAIVEYDSIITEIQIQVEIGIPSIQADLNEITAQNIMEENEVYVSKIFLEKILDPEYTLDSIQRDTLTSIAAQCPLDGGGAVIRARALLWSPELENLHPGGSCSGIYGLRSGNKVSETFEIHVIPNPNNGMFEVQIVEKGKEGQYNIRIFDTKGKLWRILETSEQRIQIDLRKEPGLYFMTITKADGSSYTKKICVF